ncbi:MAG TPA: glycosyltransferase family 4 protein [Gemmatimonadaceae bacterium]
MSDGAARHDSVRRLLFVGTNRGPGGTESHFVSLTRAMADAGYEVAAVVHPDDVIARALATHRNIQLHSASFHRVMDRKAMATVSNVCQTVRPDWIVGTFAREFWPLSIIARAQGIPLALFLHIQRLSRLSAPLFPWFASRFLLPSEYLRDWVVRRRGMPRWRTRVLYNPIDVDRFRPQPAMRESIRRRLGFTPNDIVIGFAGRFERQKGVMVLASALERVMAAAPAVRALWVGDGELAPEMEAAISASPHAKRHVRQPWSDNVVTCYSAMDILAFPSIRRESFGRVAAEAQACGVPVVASRVGGIPETLRENESGLLVEPGDVDAWSAALLRLVEDRALCSRMGSAGRLQACERFAEPHIAADFGRILELPNEKRVLRAAITGAARPAPGRRA